MCGPKWAPTVSHRPSAPSGPASSASTYITADGTIQQTNPVDEVVTRDQAWIYNGINIYVAGNFDETVPNAAQMDALAQLCAWLLNKHNLAEGAIRGRQRVHRHPLARPAMAEGPELEEDLA